MSVVASGAAYSESQEMNTKREFSKKAYLKLRVRSVSLKDDAVKGACLLSSQPLDRDPGRVDLTTSQSATHLVKRRGFLVYRSPKMASKKLEGDLQWDNRIH